MRCPATARSALTAVHLHAAHAQAAARGIELDLLLLRDRAGNQRAGDHRAEAFHGEDAVDGQAEVAGGVLLRHRGGDARQFAAQFVQAGAGGGTHRHDGRAFQERAGDQLLHFQAHQSEDVGIHQIGLGERDDAARNAQQAADIEVLAGLRLDGFVGGDHEQHQVDAADAGQHVLDEALVAGNVDEAQAQGGRELQVGEAEVDGDAAALLFFQAVGVDAGERFDQRGLAVVDVAGGADDDVLHQSHCYSASRAC